MKQTELNTILGAMLDAHTGISDLVFSVGQPMQVEAFGELKPVHVFPSVKKLTRFQTRSADMIVGTLRLSLG